MMEIPHDSGQFVSVSSIFTVNVLFSEKKKLATTFVVQSDLNQPVMAKKNQLGYKIADHTSLPYAFVSCSTQWPFRCPTAIIGANHAAIFPDSSATVRNSL